MNLTASNFAALRQQYGKVPSVGYVNRILTSFAPEKLDKLLDHHSNRTYYDEDVDRRAAFDDVLAYYSLMEVAAIASYIPAEFPPSYVREALARLERPAVRTYYEENYTLLLPQLHRKRLRGQWRPRESGKNLPASFIAFTQLNKTLADADVKMFLGFLEDISVGGESLEDLQKIIGDPQKFTSAFVPSPSENAIDLDEVWEKLDDVEALRDPAKLARQLDSMTDVELTPAQQSLHGFRKFLFFCRDFHRLLESLSDSPLTQSAMWHHHGYWFGEFRSDLQRSMRRAVQQFLAWDVDERQPGAREMRDAEVTGMLAAIDAVTSNRYRVPLEAAARAADRPLVVPKSPVVIGVGLRLGGAPAARKKTSASKRGHSMSAAAHGARKSAPAAKKRVARKTSGAKKAAAAKSRYGAKKASRVVKKSHSAKRSGAKAAAKKTSARRSAPKRSAAKSRSSKRRSSRR